MELRHHDANSFHHQAVVFFCEEMACVAQQILESKLGRKYLVAGKIRWNTFYDGFPNLMIEDVEFIRGRHVIFLADFYNPRNLFSQLSIIYELPRYFVKSLMVILAYFPTGTMERVETEGQIATANTLARMLSSIPLTQSGPTKLAIFDIHALQSRFYFGTDTIPLLLSGIPLLKEALRTRHAGEKLAIAFPDEGASKRFGTMFNEYPNVICTKVREQDQRIVKLKEGDVQGYHVVIVDDLVQTGGTLLETKNVLLRAGATRVSAYVTHAVFPRDSWKKFTTEDPSVRFAVFYITDSCPEMAYQIRDKAPFALLPLASLITDSVVRYGCDFVGTREGRE